MVTREYDKASFGSIDSADAVCGGNFHECHMVCVGTGVKGTGTESIKRQRGVWREGTKKYSAGEKQREQKDKKRKNNRKGAGDFSVSGKKNDNFKNRGFIKSVSSGRCRRQGIKGLQLFRRERRVCKLVTSDTWL